MAVYRAVRLSETTLVKCALSHLCVSAGAPGAISHAVGAANGRAAIKILVEELTPEVLAGAPRQIDDIPVVVEAIGKVVAF